MDPIKELETLTQQLESTKSKEELAPISLQIKKAAIHLHIFRLTQTDFNSSNNSAFLAEILPKLLVARKAFETLVILSVRHDDFALFQQSYKLLQPFYTDLLEAFPEDQRDGQRIPTLKLALLYYITETKHLDEFHYLIELITPEEKKNEDVIQILELEQAFTEGYYNKVLQLTKIIAQKIPDSALILERINCTSHHNIGAFLTTSSKRFRLSSLKAMYDISEQVIQKLQKEFNWDIIEKDDLIITNQTAETLAAIKPKTNANYRIEKASQYDTNELIVDLIHIAKDFERVV